MLCKIEKKKKNNEKKLKYSVFKKVFDNGKKKQSFFFKLLFLNSLKNDSFRFTTRLLTTFFDSFLNYKNSDLYKKKLVVYKKFFL